MSFLALVFAVGCGRAEAGDLWLSVDTVKGGEEVHLHVPANWLAEVDEPVLVQTPSGPVDLRAEAAALRGRKVGSEARFALADGSLRLTSEAATGAPATRLEVVTVGPKGNGLTLSMELEPEQLGAARGSLDAVVDVDGLSVNVDEALCAQLRASPPTELLATTGPKGGGIRVATR